MPFGYDSPYIHHQWMSLVFYTSASLAVHPLGQTGGTILGTGKIGEANRFGLIWGKDIF